MVFGSVEVDETYKTFKHFSFFCKEKLTYCRIRRKHLIFVFGK